MMEQIRLEPQFMEMSNSDNQVFINEPERTSDMEVEMNVQQTQDNLLQSDVAQVKEEVSILNQDELQDLKLSKCREHDAESLTRLLRIETELLAKTKAKEEVMVCILQSHIQESQENRHLLEQQIATLSNHKEELQQKLNLELVHRGQIEEEMSNTGKMKTMLKDHFATVQKNYESIQGSAQELEQEQKEQLENYQIKKQQICTAIENGKWKLLEIRSCLEKEHLQHEIENNEKHDRLKELCDADINLTNEIMRVKNKHDNLQSKFNKNDEILKESLSRQQELGKLLNNFNLEELEAQKVEQKQKNKEALDALKTNLARARERLDGAEQQENTLRDSLVEQTDLTSKLDEAHAKAEDEFVSLSSAQKLFISTIEDIETRSTNICNGLGFELQGIEHALDKCKQRLSSTLRDKEEKMNDLHILQQRNQEQQAKLANLQSLKKNLTEQTDLSTTNLTQLTQHKIDRENEVKKLTFSLLETKEKYLQNEETYNRQLSELDEKLFRSGTELQGARHEYESKVKQLKDELSVYKMQTAKADQENQQINKQKLQQLEEQLAKVKANLEHTKECFNGTTASIDQKKAICAKLENERQTLVECHGFLLTEESSSQQFSKQPTKPTSILKSAKKSTSPAKKVSFFKSPTIRQISSDNRVATNVEVTNINQESTIQWNSSDEFFEKLLRTSPPQLLQDSKSRKRSRLDSP